jgi:hypothetical protein
MAETEHIKMPEITIYSECMPQNVDMCGIFVELKGAPFDLEGLTQTILPYVVCHGVTFRFDGKDHIWMYADTPSSTISYANFFDGKWDMKLNEISYSGAIPVHQIPRNAEFTLTIPIMFLGSSQFPPFSLVEETTLIITGNLNCN